MENDRKMTLRERILETIGPKIIEDKKAAIQRKNDKLRRSEILENMRKYRMTGINMTLAGTIVHRKRCRLCNRIAMLGSDLCYSCSSE